MNLATEQLTLYKKKEFSIIDIGTGTGMPLESLINISKPREIIALDYNSAYCRSAERRFSSSPEVEVVQADFNKFKTSKKFDEVFFGFSLMIIPDRIKVHQAS